MKIKLRNSWGKMIRITPQKELVVCTKQYLQRKNWIHATRWCGNTLWLRTFQVNLTNFQVFDNTVFQYTNIQRMLLTMVSATGSPSRWKEWRRRVSRFSEKTRLQLHSRISQRKFMVWCMETLITRLLLNRRTLTNTHITYNCMSLDLLDIYPMLSSCLI